VVTKAISLGVWWYLPDEGVEIHEETNFNPAYQRVDFKNMLSSKAVKISSAGSIKQENSASITNMILNGLYGNKAIGFVIVALKSNPKKTSIIAVGESYSGYKLKSILSGGAIFTKAGKEFFLKIQLSKTGHNISSSISHVQESGVPHNVSRQDIKYYEKNPDKIWKDISIMELKDGKKLAGFKVTRVRKGSKMDRLGLKRGDVIIRANNVELTSYKSAFDLYKNINKLTTVDIVVLRNNEEKELVYEIH
jgi:type II secretion system protein C